MENSNNNYGDWRENRRREWEERRARRMSRVSHGGIYVGHHSSRGHIALGIIALLIGGLFLLQNLGYVFIGSIWQFWPVIIVAVGVAHVLDSRSLHSVLWGVLLCGVGLIFMANNLGYLPWPIWGLIWPAFIIFWGLILLARGFGRRGYWGETHSPVDDTSTTSNNILNEMVVFGGIHRKIECQDFQGGEARAVFGGIDIDLRGAATTKDAIEIVANAVFGGIELRVPDTWDVTVRGAGILGGYEDKTHPAPVIEGSKRPQLVIRGEAVFGGVTVRN
jgi:predicted membrane protein